MAVEIKELKEYIEASYGKPETVYLDLQVKRVRLLVYSDEFNQHIENQIPYIISGDSADRYDATIVLWKEKDPAAPDIIREYDKENETYYYGVKSLKYEEFIKQGHFLVQTFYQILNTEYSSLVHGAAVGAEGEGVLICAKGQRGKSTLSVMAMFLGMEYVSDDYLILEKDRENQILASPIYSIITLSPYMTEKMKEHLTNAVKLGNNARKDKFVFNISCMHNHFRERYPIRAMVFPEILGCEKPFIRKATPAEKSRAAAQILHSTAEQMNAKADTAGTKKLIGMISQFECYYIGLSADIEQNAKLLKEFVSKRKYNKHEVQAE
ncbi:MAG: hypothetical protein Q4F70_06015 [Clostridia bacterium]|nr:hypothetical protein [Clostridia bacterium]